MKGLITLGKFIFGESSKNSFKSYPSLADCLKKMLGVKAWQQLLRRTPDRRQIIEEAAFIKGISQEELIKQIGERFEMPLIFRPKPVDLTSLPDGIILPDLRRAGVLPIIAERIVSGVVCVDPSELNLLPGLYAGSNIYLSSWQSILAALDESELLYREKKLRERTNETEQEIILCKRVLGRLVEQAKEVNSNSLSLISDLDALVYKFSDQSGSKWSGRVDTKIAKKLSDFIEESVASGAQSVKALSSRGEDIKIEIGAQHGEIHLSFGEFNNIASLSVETEHRSRKVVAFPRLLKREPLELNPNFISSIEGTVLLVEDNSTFAQILQKYLLKQGLLVEYYQSAEEAFSRLVDKAQVLPDLILTDLNLSAVGGLEFIRMLKSEQFLKQIPIVALTNDENPETELNILAEGVDAFVTKTKDPRILCLHAKRLIELRRAA